MRAREFLKEIDFAHALVDLTSSQQDIVIQNSNVIGNFNNRDINYFHDGDINIYSFIGDTIDALIFLQGNVLHAMKNYTDNNGLVYALMHYIVDIQGKTIMLRPSDALTKDGIIWMVSQIHQKGFNITDQDGGEIAPEQLKKEWDSAIDGAAGPTGIVISESTRAHTLRENENSMMKYDMFGLYCKGQVR